MRKNQRKMLITVLHYYHAPAFGLTPKFRSPPMVTGGIAYGRKLTKDIDDLYIIRPLLELCLHLLSLKFYLFLNNNKKIEIKISNSEILSKLELIIIFLLFFTALRSQFKTI